MKSVLVISPHLDDAALSCGQFLAGRPDTVVLTLFCGTPSAEEVTTSYDSTCGFGSAREAVTSRREEDKLALAVLEATHIHADLPDGQYGEAKTVDQVADVIRQAIEDVDPEFIVGPLGLLHPDHQLARDALLLVAEEDERPVWLYEDLPGRMLDPECVPVALEAIRAGGWIAEKDFVGDGPLWKKMLAMWCYKSQVGLFNPFDIFVQERFWKIRKGGSDAAS